MNIIYRITDTINNLKYIGSKMHYVEGGGYLGSPSCKEGHIRYEKQKLFKKTVKKNPNKVVFEILETIDGGTKKFVRERETYWQKKYNATNDDHYINGILANATGRSCKGLVTMHKETLVITKFSSISQCEEALKITNVGACLLGKRNMTKGYFVISLEDYENTSKDPFKRIVEKYRRGIEVWKSKMVNNYTKQIVICNIKTEEYIFSTRRKVFYDKKELNWEQKYLFLTDNLVNIVSQIKFFKDRLNSFSKLDMLKLKIQITKNSKSSIELFEDLVKNYNLSKIKNCLTGYRKNIEGVKFKIV